MIIVIGLLFVAISVAINETENLTIDNGTVEPPLEGLNTTNVTTPADNQSDPALLTNSSIDLPSGNTIAPEPPPSASEAVVEEEPIIVPESNISNTTPLSEQIRYMNETFIEITLPNGSIQYWNVSDYFRNETVPPSINDSINVNETIHQRNFTTFRVRAGRSGKVSTPTGAFDIIVLTANYVDSSATLQIDGQIRKVYSQENVSIGNLNVTYHVVTHFFKNNPVTDVVMNVEN